MTGSTHTDRLDMVTRGDVENGKSIGLSWIEEEWLATSSDPLPISVYPLLSEILVDVFDLPGETEIDDFRRSSRLNPDTQVFVLDEWLHDPQAPSNGTILIPDAALVKENDVWVVDPRPRDELEIIVETANTGVVQTTPSCFVAQDVSIARTHPVAAWIQCGGPGGVCEVNSADRHSVSSG
jgi:hypothetical protein